MSTRRSDIVAGAGFRVPDDDELSIIDVFEFDDSVDEKWLLPSGGTSSRRNSCETKVEDLDAWLHADVPESDAAQSESNSRKSFDSRTFTRIKRRSNNRLSFDGVESESAPFSLSNVWKNQPIPESSEQIVNNNNTNKNDAEKNLQRERRENIPMMLRPKTNQVLAAILSESPSSISSQASMEAFMNMASSKEGISLLSDLSDPDMNSFLMNVSQPSLLYSSLMSEGRGDESIHAQVPTTSNSLIDSQILTDSMMEASMFKEVQDTTMIAEFLKQTNDCSILNDRTFTEGSDPFDSNDKTFVNDRTFEQGKEFDSFITSPFCKNDANSTRILSSPDLDATQILTAIASLNSTRNFSDEVLSSTQTLSSDNKNNLTFELKPSQSSSREKLDATYQNSGSSAGQLPHLGGSNENCVNTLNSTFDAIPNLRAELLQEVKRSSGNKFDSTYANTQTNFNTTYDRPSSAEPIDKVKPLDSTYVNVSPPRKSVPQNKKTLDLTYDNVPQADSTYVKDLQTQDLHSTYVQESQNLKMSLDATFDTNKVNSKLNNPANIKRVSYAPKKSESQMQSLDQNRFNTFKKESKSISRLSKAPLPQENSLKKIPTAQLQVKNNENLNQQRFNTFTKKMSIARNNVYNENNINENTFVASQDNQMDNTYVQPQHDGTSVRPSLDGTFVKPQEPNKLDSTFIKPIRKIPAPRQLSKLPQLFQKSNPNLGSSLRPVSGLSRMSSDCYVSYNKGSQPNMHTLSRYNSEQRLVQPKSIIEFSKNDGTSRSMESIESTASVHSAPDFDDRLSICSDISRTSYTIKPKALDKVANMDGKFGGSTPKIKERKILENTWMEEKDLPSPISKNGIAKSITESADSLSTSPSESADYGTAKTSSPLDISPASSDQAINSIGNDNIDIESTKENIQAANNVKPKPGIKAPTVVSNTNNATKLRRPTNWTGPNKVANGAVSGIPRPASRIPAPKFARPNQK